MNQELDEKLSRLVNGSLNPAEQAEVEAALKEDPGLEKEVEFLTALRSGLKREDEASHSPGELGLARLKKDIQAQEKRPVNASPVWKRVAIAACAILSLQTAFFATQYIETDGTDITTLSGGAAAAGPVVQVIFADAATAAQIRRAVLQVDGSIVAGPSALGLYHIAVPESDDPALALATLRDFPFVEQAVLE